MAAKIVTLLPIGSPAFRVNLFSAILAILVLILAYIIINKSSVLIFGTKNNAINYLNLLILAFSYIFWNQSIEAKGGIYILNLLFLAILVYLNFAIFEKFKMKYLYLISYIYGLSLTNHWPSMIILFPVFAFAYYRNLNRITAKQMLAHAALFVLGLTAYIYLPVRGCADGIYVFMAKPNTWGNFWWTVLRSGYMNSLPATISVYKSQLGEFFNLLAKDYYILSAFIIPGIYILWKKKRNFLFFCLSAFLITVGMVVFVNHTDENNIFVVDNFLLPAQFICFLIIAAGILHTHEFLKMKKYRNIFIAILACGLMLNFYNNFKSNNSRYNYLSYDFGNNILKTIQPNSLYLAEEDKYLLPMLYIQKVQNQSGNIQTFNPFLIQYKWQIDDFEKNNGKINLKENDFMENVSEIINSLIDKKPIYFTTFVQIPGKLTNEYKAKINGLLFEIVNKDADISPEIFKIYSYRGIYGTNTKYDMDLLYLYGARIAMYADELFLAGNYLDSIQMYNKALLLFEKMPNDGFINKADIYYNLSVDYEYMSDTANQLRCLLTTVECRLNYWQAYEDAGKIYFVNKNPVLAENMFQKAIYYGSPDVAELNGYINKLNNSK
jgi:hypothetical protein